jgi:hypothetical protein
MLNERQHGCFAPVRCPSVLNNARERLSFSVVRGRRLYVLRLLPYVNGKRFERQIIID